MKKIVNIGLVGFGTVGVGVYKILDMLSSKIESKVGAKVKIKCIVTKDVSKAKKLKYDKKIVSKNINDILNDPEIDIVVELIGGYEPARTFILDALKKGKHVVTANKAVLAKYWKEIHSTAKKNNALIYFESSVGAGIPIIQGLNEGLSANRIDEIYGILNGTTNFILTKMLKEKMDFKEALKIAQEKGFAEANPTTDISGMDAAHKLAILASLSTDNEINVSQVHTEGIENIKAEDVAFAEQEFGFVIKLLGIMKRDKESIELRVHPTLIPKQHLLASVDNEYNAIYVIGNTTGKTMFYGKGAGELPAASGVVGDIVYIARQVINGTAGKNPLVTFSKKDKIKVKKMEDIESRYYIRFSAIDKSGVLSKVSGILGKYNVSIAACVQHQNSGAKVPVIMTTHKAKEKDVKRAIKEIDKSLMIKTKTVFIRIEDKI